ncbi:MAG: hypothetical protein WDN47_01270 [Candidatus Doudnabacteria bacterium]
MAEIPEKPIETGHIPENMETKSLKPNQEAGEFLDSQRDKTTRSWPTEAEREQNADKVQKIISPDASKEQSAEEVHNEAGMPLKIEYKTEAQKRKAIEDMMNSGASGNDQTEALREILG